MLEIYEEGYDYSNIIDLTRPLAFKSPAGGWTHAPVAGDWIQAQGGDASQLLKDQFFVIHFVTRRDSLPTANPGDFIFCWIGTEEGDVGIYYNYEENGPISLDATLAIEYHDILQAMDAVGVSSDFFKNEVEAKINEMIDG